MRITLSIDDDVLTAAKTIAERDNKTVGEILSALARKVLHASHGSGRSRNGVPLLPIRGRPKTVTLAVVNRLR